MAVRTREELCSDLNEINKTVLFKDAHLELVSDRTSNKYFKFIQEHFFPDGVIAKSIGLDVDKGVINYLRCALHDNLSILLVSDISGEVIACRGITIEQRGKPTNMSALANEKLKFAYNFTFPEHEKAIYDYYNVNTCVKFRFLATHRAHRKQGIADKMMEAAPLFTKRLGLDTVCIQGSATSNYSQRIYEKYGFETIRTSRYSEYKIGGEIVFKNTGEHESFKLYFKKLS